MRLAPVDPELPLRLRDEDAVTDDVPKRKKLKKKLEKRLERLAELQGQLYADGRFALLVVLQGRDTAGKDGTIRRVFRTCNQQGCDVTSFKAPTPLELRHDFLWRVHQAVPAHGMIGIFNRSHYEDVLAARVRDLVPKRIWQGRYDQINDFERMLARNGVAIVKFFLHISKDEQHRRLCKRIEQPNKNWKFCADDFTDREHWDDYTEAYRDALRRCSTQYAPWFIVPSDDKLVRNYLIAGELVRTLDRLCLRYPEADPHILEEAERLFCL